MPETIGVTKAITNLNVAHERLNLSPTNDPHFFTEWQQDLPELTEEEKLVLNRLIVFDKTPFICSENEEVISHFRNYRCK